MAKHLRIKTSEDDCVHHDLGKMDYTLCGLDILGDPSIGIQKAKETTDKVDCGDCLYILNVCAQILKSEARKPTKKQAVKAFIESH